MKIICYLFGCDSGEAYRNYCCPRCGVYYEDAQVGIFPRVIYFFENWREFIYHNIRRRWPFKHCDQCGKFMFSFTDDVPLCSEKCLREWMPF